MYLQSHLHTAFHQKSGTLTPIPCFRFWLNAIPERGRILQFTLFKKPSGHLLLAFYRVWVCPPLCRSYSGVSKLIDIRGLIYKNYLVYL